MFCQTAYSFFFKYLYLIKLLPSNSEWHFWWPTVEVLVGIYLGRSPLTGSLELIVLYANRAPEKFHKIVRFRTNAVIINFIRLLHSSRICALNLWDLWQNKSWTLCATFQLSKQNYEKRYNFLSEKEKKLKTRIHLYTVMWTHIHTHTNRMTSSPSLPSLPIRWVGVMH